MIQKIHKKVSKNFSEDIIKFIRKIMERNYVTILMYHGVVKSPLRICNWAFIEENCFRNQIKYINKHYEIIPLSNIIERLNTKCKKPTAIITFDDGYQNNYDIALPILKEEKTPATIFLTTGKINTDDTLGVCRLHHAFETTKKNFLDWNGFRYKINNRKTMIETLNSIKLRLKSMHNNRMKSEVQKIILKLNCKPDYSFEKRSPFRMLSYNSIQKMVDSYLIEFGAHTHSHSILSRCSYEEQKYEIEESINTVKKLTGRACKYFAYPNGTEKDYNKDTVRILHSLGIEIALTTCMGFNNPKTELYELKRYGVGESSNLSPFVVNIHNRKALVKEALKGFSYNL